MKDRKAYCPSCDNIVDRDTNATENIYKKA
ncbi:MAG: transposase [Methanobrevibacter sp.]|nr:transposase [Candidatus Methanovirga basalitermitum]